MTWGWLPASSFLFVPVTYGEPLLCPSTSVESWLLTSSRGQQCNSRERRLTRTFTGKGWCFAHLSAGCPGRLPNIIPALLVAHRVGKCLVVDALGGLEHWPFLHLWSPHIPPVMLEGQEVSWQQAPRRDTETCRAHTGRRAVLTSVADFIRLRSLTGVEFMWK